MTDLTPYQPTADVSVLPDMGTELIMRAVEQMAGAAKLGQALASTAFVPQAFRGKPDDAAAAIMYGAAIGLDPMTSLRAVYVISGTPGLYARQMVAVVISKGHKVWTESSTDDAVTVAGQRRGSETVERVTWTYERARRAGYTQNKKYDTDPQAMLWARAAGDVARRIAPDALAGLDYSVEELQVIDHVDVSTERPRRESATDLIGTAPAPAPEAAEPEPTPSVPMATQKQLTAIRAGMGELGHKDRDEVLTIVAEMVGRPLGSSKELTRDEAGTVLDAIKEEAERNAKLAAEAPAANDDYSDTLPGVEGEVQA